MKRIKRAIASFLTGFHWERRSDRGFTIFELNGDQPLCIGYANDYESADRLAIAVNYAYGSQTEVWANPIGAHGEPLDLYERKEPEHG
jgi:hypothetical protein